MKIAHLSDLHLRHHLPGTAIEEKRLSRRMPDKLAEAVEAINAEEPDLLVISGDLLDYPLDALNDQETLDRGFEDLGLIKEILEDVDCRLAVVHGNHDHPILIRETFTDLSMEQTVADHRVLCFYDDEDIDHVPRRLGNSRHRFLAALEDEESLPQVHVQHYVIWPLLNERYPYTYHQGPVMRDQIVGSGRVRLVLSGHYHKGVELFQLDGTYFGVVPAFCEEPHPFWFYTVDGDEVTCEQKALNG